MTATPATIDSEGTSAPPVSVLVVDDEQGIRDGSERILSRMGCEVHTAARGEECLAFIERDPVAIILLDLKMPGMDGMEVLRRVRERYPDVLVIVITGFATVETAIEAMKQGAYDFIPKPFEPDQLRIVINRAREKIRLTEAARQMVEERKRTLADLDAEKSRIRTIIETLPNGLVVTNTAGQVVLMNPAFRWLLKLGEDRSPGAPIETYVHDEGFCQMVKAVSVSCLPDSADAPACEFAVGDERYLLAKGRPILAEDSECLGAAVTVVDITAMKMIDRLKSEFVATVSHELRSPLSTIHEQLALVLKETAEKESEKEQYLLKRAKEKTMGLISLIGDMLDLSRIENGITGKDVKPVNIDETLRIMIDFMGARAEAKHQRLRYACRCDALPMVSGDPVALESIFGNLITNAINYTPEEGDIQVTAEVENGSVVVRVADTGFGIEARHLSKIFDKFYRVKTAKTRFITGTGLGLSIVKGLVDGLGGTIDVKSVPDEGSTFTVRLPAWAGETGERPGQAEGMKQSFAPA